VIASWSLWAAVQPRALCRQLLPVARRVMGEPSQWEQLWRLPPGPTRRHYKYNYRPSETRGIGVRECVIALIRMGVLHVEEVSGSNPQVSSIKTAPPVSSLCPCYVCNLQSESLATVQFRIFCLHIGNVNFKYFYILFCMGVIGPCYMGHCHYGMARPRVPVEGHSVQIKTLAANLLNKLSWSANKKGVVVQPGGWARA
jgi:hypothetical protein